MRSSTSTAFVIFASQDDNFEHTRMQGFFDNVARMLIVRVGILTHTHGLRSWLARVQSSLKETRQQAIIAARDGITVRGETAVS